MTSTPTPKAVNRPSIWDEYYSRNLAANPIQVNAERKRLVQQLERLTERKVIIYAVDPMKSAVNIPPLLLQMNHEDPAMFAEMVRTGTTSRTGLILINSLGGFPDVAENFVHILRAHFDDWVFFIPNQAKSAATMLAMSGSEIWLDEVSDLGPIDPQISVLQKLMPAHTLRDGFRKIIEDTRKSQSLDLAYIPMLQNLSPADLQFAENAIKLSEDLVTHG